MIEEELLKGIADREENAFEELYNLTHKRVFRYLYRLTGDQQIAEDILVDTYTEVWKSANRFRGQSKVLTWITGIARNLAMNEFRSRRPHESIEALHNQLSENPPAIETTEREKLLARAICRLSIKHQEILDLVFLQEMTYEDVSQIINAPLNTVKTRVFYAKEEMRKILKEMGVGKDDLF